MTPVQRKRKTEALLIRKGIPYLSWLPCIEPEEETELRTAEEIGIRILCLSSVIGAAYHPTDPSYKIYLKKQRLWKHLTRDELIFLMNPNPEPQTCKGFTWRIEAMFVLMWAVGLFKRLPFPVRQVANQKIIDKLSTFDGSPRPFIHSLKLRPKSQIMDKSDLIYRLHWATRQARLEGLQPPGGLNPDVVYEWHYAINWIVKYNDADWDDVTADT
jgi:hypothetical protein